MAWPDRCWWVQVAPRCFVCVADLCRVCKQEYLLRAALPALCCFVCVADLCVVCRHEYLLCAALPALFCLCVVLLETIAVRWSRACVHRNK
jgi:hypothetical protein